MKMKRTSLPTFAISLFAFLLLILLLIFFPPRHVFHIFILSIPSIFVFFVLIFVFVTSAGAIMLRNYKRGALVGSYIVILLLLRYLGFTNIIYPIFLLLLTLLLIKIIK